LIKINTHCKFLLSIDVDIVAHTSFSMIQPVDSMQVDGGIQSSNRATKVAQSGVKKWVLTLIRQKMMCSDPCFFSFKQHRREITIL